MRLEHGQTPDAYPRVYTENTCYEPNHVEKHPWGVKLLGDDKMKSIPWHRVRSIDEEYEEY